MAKIEELTKEQELLLPIHRDEWLKNGLRTETIDKQKSTLAIENLYQSAGLEKPRVMHFQSPWQCIMVINFVRKFGDFNKANLGANLWANLEDNLGANLGANLEANLWDNLGDNLWANLGANLEDNLGANLWANLGDNLGANLEDNLGANLWANLGANLEDNLGANLWANIRDNLGANLEDNLGANLWANLGANLEDNLGANLEANLWDNLGANLEANIRDNLWANLGDNLGANLEDSSKYEATYFWGGLDSYWLAFYDFGQKIGVKYDKKEHFEAHKTFSKTCGISYLYNGLAFVSDRPEIIRKNESTALHCEDGPALMFRDGYSIHCWNGTNVPKEWIENTEEVSPTDILKCDNVEQRAAGCQILGWAKMLDHLNHKIIDSDENPEHGDLIELNLEGLPEPEWYLRFYCPRNGLMMEGVNKRELKEPTVFAAQAWKSPIPDELFSYPETRS